MSPKVAAAAIMIEALAWGLLAAVSAVAAPVEPVLKCSAIYLHGLADGFPQAEYSVLRKTGTRHHFQDPFFSGNVEITALGMFLELRELATGKVHTVKADLAAEKPYFDLILPLSSPRKDKRLKTGPVDHLEFECK